MIKMETHNSDNERQQFRQLMRIIFLFVYLMGGFADSTDTLEEQNLYTLDDD